MNGSHARPAFNPDHFEFGNFPEDQLMTQLVRCTMLQVTKERECTETNRFM